MFVLYYPFCTCIPWERKQGWCVIFPISLGWVGDQFFSLSHKPSILFDVNRRGLVVLDTKRNEFFTVCLFFCQLLSSRGVQGRWFTRPAGSEHNSVPRGYWRISFPIATYLFLCIAHCSWFYLPLKNCCPVSGQWASMEVGISLPKHNWR